MAQQKSKKVNYNKAELIQYARKMAQRYGIDPDLFVRQINQESGFNPYVESNAGAQGIAQIIPETARAWGVKNVFDPYESLEVAAKQMANYTKKYGSYEKALIAYNAGEGALQKYGTNVPYKETQNYVKNITGKTGSSNNNMASNVNNNNSVPQMRRVDPLSPYASEAVEATANYIYPNVATLDQATLEAVKAQIQESRDLTKEEKARQVEQIDNTLNEITNMRNAAVGRSEAETIPVRQYDQSGNFTGITYLSPRQYAAATQQQYYKDFTDSAARTENVLNPLGQSQQDISQRMLDRLNAAYALTTQNAPQQIQIPYQGLTPEQVRRNAAQQQGMLGFAAATTGDPMLYAMVAGNKNQNQLATDQLAYQQAVANTYGMPYEQVVNALNQRATSANALGQKYLEQIAKMNELENTRATTGMTGMEQLAGRRGALAGTMGTNAQGMYNTDVNNQVNAYLTAMNNYAKLKETDVNAANNYINALMANDRNFANFVTGTLVPELQTNQSAYNNIARNAADVYTTGMNIENQRAMQNQRIGAQENIAEFNALYDGMGKSGNNTGLLTPSDVNNISQSGYFFNQVGRYQPTVQDWTNYRATGDVGYIMGTYTPYQNPTQPQVNVPANNQYYQ